MVTVAQLTTLDPAVLTGLDFDPELPCEARGHVGETRPAEWRLEAVNSCGHAFVALICEPCRLLFRDWEARRAAVVATGRVVSSCTECWARIHPMQDVTITPLRGEGS